MKTISSHLLNKGRRVYFLSMNGECNIIVESGCVERDQDAGSETVLIRHYLTTSATQVVDRHMSCVYLLRHQAFRAARSQTSVRIAELTNHLLSLKEEQKKDGAR